MQNLKERFLHPDHSQLGTIQRCIRTNDLELVGDGSHLTHFEMVGNFSFGRNDYESSVLLWDRIVRRLEIPVTHVTVHPDRSDHRLLWERLGYTVVWDPECVWSDGNIGGFCCEMFVGDLEIGNLVNTLGHSTDVGFGLERLLQVIEGKSRVDETSLFRQDLHPVVRDHERTITLFWEQGIQPGFKGREFICRRLIRRMVRYLDGSETFPFQDWLIQEKEIQQTRFRQARRMLRGQKHRNKPLEWWWESVGILPEELEMLKKLKWE